MWLKRSICFFSLILLIPAPALTQSLERLEAGRMLLAEGVGGLRRALDAAEAPPLTFDQETQVRVVYEDHARALDNLVEANGGRRLGVEPEIRLLEEQLLLAALKFLNPVQRTALAGSVAAADFAQLNSDLPEDPGELREYLQNLSSPAGSGGGGRGGGLVVDGFGGGGRMPDRNEIQEIRINENSFTAEQSNQSRGRTEIITRGGTGEFNGDATFEFADESLDARNPFASSRPPYQQREFSANFSGPFIRDRLTLTFGVRHDTSEDGDTIRAITPEGLIDDAIVRPGTNRDYSTRATAQLNEGNLLNTSFSYRTSHSENNNVGGIRLPEQGSIGQRSGFNFQIRETAVLSRSWNNEVRFRMNRSTDEQRPVTDAPHINVQGAFRAGGSTESSEGTSRNYEFGDLLMYTGGRLSLRTGFEGRYESERALSQNNFNGTFVFADLDGFRAGEPILYTVNRGEPLLELSQFQYAAFVQSDLRVSPELTMSFGVRYQNQTGLDDNNNIDPRVGFAYALGSDTVLRGGTGIFHDRFNTFMRNQLIRFDGTRQRSLEIIDPPYPDPFAGDEGELSVPSSVRIVADDLAAPYSWNSELSLETSFDNGLVLTGSYRFVRGMHLFRSRNLNAPLDLTAAVPRSCGPDLDAAMCARPDPDRGNINRFESTGTSSTHNLRVGFRRRFSFMNLNGSYNFNSAYSDVPGWPFNLPADNYDLDSEWGRDGNRHSIDASVNFRLPWNVNADTQFDWQSGEPYTLRTGTDDNQDTSTNDRPPGVPRNSLTGPGFFEIDMRLSKAIQLREEGTPVGEGPVTAGPAASGGYYGQRSGVRMTISADFRNLLNTTNFTNISGVLSSPFFGQPTRARDGRSVSLSMRFDF